MLAGGWGSVGEMTVGEGDEEQELQSDNDMSNSVALDLQRVPLIVSVSQVGVQGF